MTLTHLAAVQLEDGDTFAYSSGVATKIAPPVNPTGIRPTEYKVLVKPKAAEEVTKGGIIIPTSTTDSEQFAQTEGTIVAQSPLAHSYATEDEWKAAGATKPKPGDRILYAKFAGVWVKGKDEQKYLLIQDKDICATIDG